MKNYLNTNLIIESSYYKDDAYFSDIAEERVNGIKIERCVLKNSKPSFMGNFVDGHYVTIELPELSEILPIQTEDTVTVLSNELRALVKSSCNKEINKALSVLIVGIGNRHITPDSIGPLVVEKLSVTRHLAVLSKRVFDSIGSCKVCAISCGVMGETGIESLDIIKGVLSRIHVDVVVAVDALAARETRRLSRVVQLCDTGISPGAGVGNRRQTIDKAALGVPIIAIGVPTVISAATMVADAFMEAGIEAEEKITSSVLDNCKQLFVTPKNCDSISESVSAIIARGIDKTFCGI